MNMGVQASLWGPAFHSFSPMPAVRRLDQTVFPLVLFRGSTGLSPQQRHRQHGAGVPGYPCQHLLLPFSMTAATLAGEVMRSHCAIDLHCSDGWEHFEAKVVISLWLRVGGEETGAELGQTEEQNDSWPLRTYGCQVMGPSCPGVGIQGQDRSACITRATGVGSDSPHGRHDPRVISADPSAINDGWAQDLSD